MTKTIEIDLREDENGNIDTAAMISQLERAVGYRFRVTDWIDEGNLRDDYAGIEDQQVKDALFNLSIGDYDTAIDRDIRRSVLDETVTEAGFDADGNDEEEAEEEVLSLGR